MIVLRNINDRIEIYSFVNWVYILCDTGVYWHVLVKMLTYS